MDKVCTIYIQHDGSERSSEAEIRKQLQNGDVYEKREALKKAILLISNGEPLPQVLMPVIQFVMPSKDHELKKLMILYWEVIPKKNAEGKLLPEMILVCNSLRNDLNHPNEYIRGATLRFLCKLKEAELLEPLVPSVRANLEHRHSYVRRNAVMAIFYIYKEFDYLLPDGPELIFDYLSSETDASCKRNAFIMLYRCAEEKAVAYLRLVLDQVSGFGDILQLIVVELIRRVCRRAPEERGNFVRCIHKLLDSDSAAVRFESAGALLALSAAPTAIRAASATYIELLSSQSDHNVKMIVLDKLQQIKKRNTKVLQELLMDILRALSSPNMDIRRKVLDIAMDLACPRNIDQVVQVLRKEVAKTQAVAAGAPVEKAAEYRQMLIQAIHQCAVRFPEVANSVIHVLIDFVGDADTQSAMDVIVFVREVVETYEELRPGILERLIECFPLIQCEVVFRAALWIIGEYSRSAKEVDRSITTVLTAIGTKPLGSDGDDTEDANADEKEGDEGKEGESDSSKNAYTAPASAASKAPLVLPDGTYATQSAMLPSGGTEAAAAAAAAAAGSGAGGSGDPKLRCLVEQGDFFLASTVATTLTKLALKMRALGLSVVVCNALSADLMLLIVRLIRYGEKVQTMCLDNKERMLSCLTALSCQGSEDPQVAAANDALWLNVFTVQGRLAFSELLAEQRLNKETDHAEKQKASEVQPDALIRLRQLKPRREFGASADDDDLDDVVAAEAAARGEDPDVVRAAGYGKRGAGSGDGHASRKRHIHQMTGYSDLIYAEAFVHVHQYDIVLDVMILNQTGDTLQNLSLELATLGDLKLCERPQSYTVGPHGTVNIKANIKVSSTETGVIFGSLVYNVAGSGASDSNIVILNDIHIDIMDYIVPATCSDTQFRSMWMEFEWENKVVVNTTISDPKQYLEHILRSTNMKCLTPTSALAGDSAFLAANLYAKSTFGEDALVNLGIERRPDGKIVGHIRIRAKTQGIALSLGDKITLEQRSVD